MKTSLLAVFGKDRPGIIASVTGVLYETRCNLEDITMTILESEFAMLVVVSYDGKQKLAVDKRLQVLSKKSKLVYSWTEITGPRIRGEAAKDARLYVVSAIGRDRTGIVYQISRELAAQKLNILDLNSKILGQAPKSIYAMVLEIAVPKNYKISALEKILARTAKKLKIDLTLKPVERLEF